MRFLVDENFPATASRLIEAAGHDVAEVRVALLPGAGDLDVLRLAVREARILRTLDKDFGDLARGGVAADRCGVVLFRLPPPPPSEIGRRFADVVLSRDDWMGHFSVVEPSCIRMRAIG